MTEVDYDMPDEAQIIDWEIGNDHHDEAYYDEVDEYYNVESVPVVSAQRHLFGRLQRLPLSRMLPEPPEFDRTTDEDYLDEVSVWMELYLERVAEFVKQAQADKVALISLEVQRNAVRRFLGTDLLENAVIGVEEA